MIAFGTGTGISFQGWHAPISTQDYATFRITLRREKKANLLYSVHDQAAGRASESAPCIAAKWWVKKGVKEAEDYDIIDATPKAFFG